MWSEQYDANAESNCASRRGQERIDVDFLNQRLFGYELAKPGQEIFKCGQVCACLAAALQSCVGPRSLHQTFGKRCVQRRQTDSTIERSGYQPSTSTEKDDWSKIRINSLSKDQLDSFPFVIGRSRFDRWNPVAAKDRFCFDFHKQRTPGFTSFFENILDLLRVRLFRRI